MTLSKKSIAGIVTLAVAAAYGVVRWRNGADDDSEAVAVTEEQPAAAD